MTPLLRILTVCVLLGAAAALLPRPSDASATHPDVSTMPCSAVHTIVWTPSNHEHHGTCTQPGPGGFIGSFGAGIPIQFQRPDSMSQARFNALLSSSALRTLCAEAHIVPAEGVSLPPGMTETQFEEANRDGQLALSPCTPPHMHF